MLGGGGAGGGVSTGMATIGVTTGIATARVGAAVAAIGGTEDIVVGEPSVMRDKASANASGTTRSCPVESLVIVWRTSLLVRFFEERTSNCSLPNLS
jgi:hypothetical protein